MNNNSSNGLPTQFGRAPGRHAGRGPSPGRGRGRGERGNRGRGRPFRGGGGRGPSHYEPRRDNNNNDNIEELGPLPTDQPCVTIAVEGCCHGQLDAIYERIQKHQRESGQTVDLLLCCGDFQSLRNLADFHSLAVPPKYRSLGDFYAYYSGVKQAPLLTIFIGGNHEASQPLQELPYGGWVAPNIYYLGYAGVVTYRGIRVGGIGGIYKSHDFCKGHYEVPPFERDTLRSVYHVRNVDVFRMKCLSSTANPRPIVDVVLSHDWPLGIEQHGDTEKLLRAKPFFRQEVERNDLGSPPNREILNRLKPKFWFSAHLHVKFVATVRHHEDSSRIEDGDGEPISNTLLIPSQAFKSEASDAAIVDSRPGPPTTQFVAAESTDPCQGPDLTEQMTRFLSLDKCLPRRPYLSIVHIPVDDHRTTEDSSAALCYDLEWLTVLAKTHTLTSAGCSGYVTVPDTPTPVTAQDMELIRQRVGPSLAIRTDFVRTVPAHMGRASPLPHRLPPPLPRQGNPQTDRFLNMLGLEHITTIPYRPAAAEQEPSAGNHDAPTVADVDDENEIDLDDDILVDDESESAVDSKRPRVGSS
jgi:lariat debranching enzyme